VEPAVEGNGKDHDGVEDGGGAGGTGGGHGA